MSRKSSKVQRKKPVILDGKFGDPLIGRFINKMNYRGKKSASMAIVYKVLDTVKEQTKEDPVKFFNQVIENVRPLIEVKARRVGGATYQVPVEVEKSRSESIAMRWLIQFAQQRKGQPMYKKLHEEFMAAYKKEGSAIKKREDTHKMAEANKAFAHYRW